MEEMGAFTTNRTLFKLVLTASCTFFLVLILQNHNRNDEDNKNLVVKPALNWRQLNKTEIGNLSVLGRILFLEEPPPEILHLPKEKYKILVWKYGKSIENRHLKQFGKEMVDPFTDCPVSSCQLSFKDEDLTKADLVIFHLHRMKVGDLPKRSSTHQIWAFLTDESPYNTFQSKNNLSNYNGVFNWSMTYRMDSDIPVPYGRTITGPSHSRTAPSKQLDVLVAVMGSNCGGRNKRWDYIHELQKHIKVDIYGGCGPLKCPGHFKQDCSKLDQYFFYLAFENSNCDDYVTEKLWWNAYQKNAIPIVMGASKTNYEKLLPPNSYLNVEDFAKPKDLADYIGHLNRTGEFYKFYEWKRGFRVVNEHGYFQSKSYHFCRACQALHYNNRENKVYKDLTGFWNPKRDCHPAWNA